MAISEPNLTPSDSLDRGRLKRRRTIVIATIFFALLLVFAWFAAQRTQIGDFVLLGNPLARGQAVTSISDIENFLSQTNTSSRPILVDHQTKTLSDGRQFMMVRYRYAEASSPLGGTGRASSNPLIAFLTFDPKTAELTDITRLRAGGSTQTDWDKLYWYGDDTAFHLWGDDRIVVVNNAGIQIVNWQTKTIEVDKKVSRETIELESGEEVPAEIVNRIPASGYYAAPFVLPLDRNRIIISTSSADTAARVYRGEEVLPVQQIFDIRDQSIKILEKSIDLPYNSRDGKTLLLSNGKYLLKYRSGLYLFNPRNLSLVTTHSPQNTDLPLSSAGAESLARTHMKQLNWHQVLINQQNEREPEIIIHDFIFKKTRKLTYDVSGIKEGFFREPERVDGFVREGAVGQFSERTSSHRYWLTPSGKDRVLISSWYYDDLPWSFAVYPLNKSQPVFLADDIPTEKSQTYAGQFTRLSRSSPNYSMMLSDGGALFIGEVWFAYLVPSVTLWDRLVISASQFGLVQVLEIPITIFFLIGVWIYWKIKRRKLSEI